MPHFLERLSFFYVFDNVALLEYLLLFFQVCFVCPLNTIGPPLSQGHYTPGPCFCVLLNIKYLQTNQEPGLVWPLKSAFIAIINLTEDCPHKVNTDITKNCWPWHGLLWSNVKVSVRINHYKVIYSACYIKRSFLACFKNKIYDSFRHWYGKNTSDFIQLVYWIDT